jgi:phospholipid/cholesterol/gamma-HCH transport system substrate-binding protein
MRIENRGAKILAIALFALLCVATLAVLYKQAGGNIRLSTPYTIRTVVPTAFQLVPNGDVRRAGVKVGKVTDIKSRGDNGVVTIELDDETAPVYRDAAVQIRTKTLVGENYLDIDPGTPRAGRIPDGGLLPLERASEAVQLDEILDSLDERTKAEVRRNLDGLGSGLDGRADELNRLFAAMRPTVADGGRVTRVLRAQKEPLAAVIDDTAKVMSAFAQRTEQVRTLARQAKVTAEAVRARDEQFGDAIRQLAPTLEQAKTSVAKLGSFSGRATPVMRDLRFAMGDLQPVATQLRPAARASRALFDEIPGLTDRLDPLLTQLRGFSKRLTPAVGPLDGFLRQVNPALTYFAPYEKEFGAFFGNVKAANARYDAVGALGRVMVMYDPSTIRQISPSARKALEAVMDAGLISPFYKTNTNAYPKPGTVDNPGTESNFRRVTEQGK